MRKKIYQDGYNEIIFKDTTKKVVIGINVMSHFGAKYKSINCKTESDALNKGKEYINKNSRVKFTNPTVR